MKASSVCKILKTERLAKDIYKIIVARPAECHEITAGQFFHIQCSEEGQSFLRRPISVCEVETDQLSFVVRKSGKGTAALCSRKEGEYLDIIGPLGNGFVPKGERVLLVGGGIGVAPLVELCKNLKDKDIKVLLGFRTEAYLVEAFKKYCKAVEVATEDGTFGYKGYVTGLLEETMENPPEMIYACGPEIMLKQIQKYGKAMGIPTQLAMEERMACGVGACLVCSCKVKAGEDWDYVRTCKEGPVFWGEEVIFDEGN
ncbi:dihydroorotate dehydrogenase electron transfer subunit [Anaerosolibacter carboniphilus]|uniref:Dihydroorotate dehydrogenase B (NAD(+)), electron transfer subunit n=1 Tax=Anaerosolibacter carboniphilus TaxID=1417629 RepID=A0A841KU36_9FIRM|nr:dihydroorotate dehydrogenase electron transfer subunit [Anaerosolibacter carboniphilus]MBB6216941.1 dihydroorotate dehydrogenase electron transfer subunit [Anaerosolibacter carboniphilus]